MFTGLIEDVGTVVRWKAQAKAGKMSFHSRLSSKSMPLGASVAVNGACLTVVERSRSLLTVDVSPETVARTNFQEITEGGAVNLERPLRLADRLGGHLVTGHVDGVAVVKAIGRRGEFTFFQFQVPPSVMRLVVPKGSIAVDGISLTVNECAKGAFSVAVIPFTMQHTNLRSRRVGDKVNIETDLIGKYVQNLLKSGRLR